MQHSIIITIIAKILTALTYSPHNLLADTRHQTGRINLIFCSCIFFSILLKSGSWILIEWFIQWFRKIWILLILYGSRWRYIWWCYELCRRVVLIVNILNDIIVLLILILVIISPKKQLETERPNIEILIDF